MKILGRTGDTWRWLNWDEYQAERLKDAGFSHIEFNYFNQVSKLCSTEEDTRKFSPDWKNVGEESYDQC